MSLPDSSMVLGLFEWQWGLRPLLRDNCDIRWKLGVRALGKKINPGVVLRVPGSNGEFGLHWAVIAKVEKEEENREKFPGGVCRICD